MPSEFRYRAREVSRVEAFSDVVFGFAITLLVVSLEAPKSYPELMRMLGGVLPFAICFFLFIDIWWEHHDYFKRYALFDRTVLALNTILLFVILFYVYPLKYMFSQMLAGLFGHGEALPPNGPRVLFTVYGLGVAAVFWLLAAMYAHAWHKRDALELNDVERIDTVESILDNLCMGGFGIVSVLLAQTPLIPLAGPVYFLIAIPKTIVPWVMGRKRRRYETVTA